MEKQVKICQSVFYHIDDIRNVNSIRKTLSDDSLLLSSMPLYPETKILEFFVSAYRPYHRGWIKVTLYCNDNLLTKLQLAKKCCRQDFN